MTYWYVEDAGGGCRAFSEVLVLVSENPRRIYKTLLPLTWEQGVTMEEMVCRKVLEMMEEAGVTKNDYLYVCSSNLFHNLHKWLTENGYPWETAKMDGLAHEVAESTFQNQIVAAGFPADVQLEERNYREFYRLVDNWLREDESRARFVKDMRVRCKPAQFRYILRANTAHTRKCSRCRKIIPPYTPMVQYRFREQGKKKSRYYHPGCTPVKPHKNKLEQVFISWQGETLSGALLAARKPGICLVCKKEIPAGDKAVHACQGKKLVFGHQNCFEPAAEDHQSQGQD